MVQLEVSDNGQTSPRTSGPTSSIKWSIGHESVSNNPNDVRKRVLSFMSTKRTEIMMIEAMEALSNYERGASMHAITKWIIANYAVLDTDKLKVQVKKAVMKALSKGSIERSETSQGSLGSSGSFVLGQKTKSRPLLRKKRKSSKAVIPKERGETSNTEMLL